MSTWTYDQDTEKNLLKVKYDKHIDKQFNKSSVVLGRLSKAKDFVGKSIEFPVEQSIGAGVSSGKLGKSSRNQNLTAELTSKKLYAKVSIDRESMQAAKKDEGSFVRFTSYPVKVATTAFNINLERQIILGDITGSGILAQVASVTGTGTNADPFIVVLADDVTMSNAETRKLVMEAFEEGMQLHIDADSEDADAVEVTDVSVENKSISLVGTPSTAPAVGLDLYIQQSKDAELIGFQGIITATDTDTYKGISCAKRRWKATVEDASAAAISTDLINKVVLDMERKCKEKPSYLLASYEQYRALLALHEDQKTYNLPAKDKNYKESLSFTGIQVMTSQGVVPVMASRFVPADQILFINDMHMKLRLRPNGFEWFDEDGTVFLREATDSYEARYGGYGDLFINPHFQGAITNLAIPA